MLSPCKNAVIINADVTARKPRFFSSILSLSSNTFPITKPDNKIAIESTMKAKILYVSRVLPKPKTYGTVRNANTPDAIATPTNSPLPAISGRGKYSVTRP